MSKRKRHTIEIEKLIILLFEWLIIDKKDTKIYSQFLSWTENPSEVGLV